MFFLKIDLIAEFIIGVDCACNSDGDEGVSYEELKNCLAPLQVFMFGQDLLGDGFGQEAFDNVDDNQDGLINGQEATHILDQLQDLIPIGSILQRTPILLLQTRLKCKDIISISFMKNQFAIVYEENLTIVFCFLSNLVCTKGFDSIIFLFSRSLRVWKMRIE